MCRKSTAAWFEARLLARYRESADKLPREQLVELESGVVRVVRQGSGSRVIVLVPDPPNVVEHHQALMAELAEDHTVFCIEMAGFGHSYLRAGLAYDLENHCKLLGELFDKLQIHQATLSIACLSGLAGMTFAARHPDRVARLVLLQVPSLDEARRWIRHVDVFRSIQTPLVGQMFMHLMRWKVLEHWYRSALPEPVDEEQYRLLYTLGRTALEQGAGFALGSAYQSLSDAVVELPRQTPQLHVWGTHDRTHERSATNRSALIGEMTRAELVEVPGCGHFPDLEQPAHYCALVRSFEKATPS